MTDGLSVEELELALSVPRPANWLPKKIEIIVTQEHPYCEEPLALAAHINKRDMLEASFDSLLQCMWQAILINDYRMKNNIPKVTKEQILEILEK